MKRSCKKAFAAILTAVLLVNSVVSGTSSVFAETLDVIETMEEDSEKDSPETIETEETEPDSPESKNKESDTFETEESTVDADSDETEADEKPETDEVVEKLQERICALPTVEEWKAMSQEQQAEIYMEVQLAADIYFDELTEEQRKDVEAERLLALLEAFTQDIMALNSGDWQVIEGVLTVTGSISLADVSETYTSIDVKEGGSITSRNDQLSDYQRWHDQRLYLWNERFGEG